MGGTLLNEVKSWRDRGKTKVLDTVAEVSSMELSILVHRGRAGRHHGRVLTICTVLRERYKAFSHLGYAVLKDVRDLTV